MLLGKRSSHRCLGKKGCQFTAVDWNSYDTLAKMQLLLLVLFSLMSVLYYFLRFQYGLQTEVPFVLYTTLVLLIAISMLMWCCKKDTHIKRLDVVIFVFFIYNVLLAIFSWYLYGTLEFLYSTKNYLTGFIIYFMVSFTLPYKYGMYLFKALLLVFVAVAAIYVAEYISVHFVGSGLDVQQTAGAAFWYTTALDKYAYSLGASHGIAMPWYQGEDRIWFRLPGPLGYPNITGLVIGFGLIASFCMAGFRYHITYAILLGILCLAALLMTGSRTAMLSTFVALFFIMVQFISWRYVTFIVFLLLFLFIVVTKGEALGHLFSWGLIMGMMEHLVTTEPWMLFRDSFLDYLFVGQGFYPVTIYADAAVMGSSVEFGIGPILTTDLYFIQVLTTYGILPSLFFLAWFFRVLWQMRCRQVSAIDGKVRVHFNVVFFSVLGVCIASTISTIHVNAIGSPQVLPAVLLMLAVFCRLWKQKEILLVQERGKL